MARIISPGAMACKMVERMALNAGAAPERQRAFWRTTLPIGVRRANGERGSGSQTSEGCLNPSSSAARSAAISLDVRNPRRRSRITGGHQPMIACINWKIC